MRARQGSRASAARLASAFGVLFLAGGCAGARTVELFNGRDLDGLYTFLLDSRYEDRKEVFTVVDGVLRISGDGLGYIGTETPYGDYRLTVEFKWGDWNWNDRIGKARDSGIFLHAVGPDGNTADGNGAFRTAIECQVMEGCVGDLMLIRGTYGDGSPVPLRLTAEVAAERDRDDWPTCQPGGELFTLERWGRLNWVAKDPAWSDTFGFRGARDVESPAGEWTRVECECRGDRIAVRVNGELVNEARDVFPARGHILLQCEGSEIFVRVFRLERL